MDEYMAPDAFLNGDNVITKVPCHFVLQGALHSLFIMEFDKEIHVNAFVKGAFRFQ